MKLSSGLLTACCLPAALAQAAAAPRQPVVDACVRAHSGHASVRYTEWQVHSLADTEDQDSGVRDRSLTHGKDVVGVWMRAADGRFGIRYRDNYVPAERIIRLAPQHAPEAFELSKAVVGSIRAGAASYLCITFNFDGPGRSGSMQQLRGFYLIDRVARPARLYYGVGADRAPVSGQQ